MSTIKYLIVAELLGEGFISTELFNSFRKAEVAADSLFDLNKLFSFHNQEKIASILKKKDYTFYQINGSECYIGKGKRSVSNGAYTVSIIKIDLKTFCLKSFIRERENHSIVFNYDELDDLIEMFPNADLIAN